MTVQPHGRRAPDARVHCCPACRTDYGSAGQRRLCRAYRVGHRRMRIRHRDRRVPLRPSL